jgi:hypothetical protein
VPAMRNLKERTRPYLRHNSMQQPSEASRSAQGDRQVINYGGRGVSDMTRQAVPIKFRGFWELVSSGKATDHGTLEVWKA